MVMTAGKAVMIARVCLGWTEEDLGKKADLPGQDVARLEREEAEMTPALFAACMKAMDLDPASLYASAAGEDRTFLEAARSRFPEDVVNFALEYAERVPGIVERDAPAKAKGEMSLQGIEAEQDVSGPDPEEDSVASDPEEDEDSSPVSSDSGFSGENSGADDLELGLTRSSYWIKGKYKPNRPVSFVMPLTGKGMEPDLPDGCLVYISRTEDLAIGQIGAFEVEDMGLMVRGVGKTCLIPRNPAHMSIPFEKVLRTLGQVVGYCPPGSYREEPTRRPDSRS